MIIVHRGPTHGTAAHGRITLVGLLLAVLAWLLAALPAHAASQPRLLAVRLMPVAAAHGGVPGAKVVLETTRAVSFDAGVQARPLRLEVLVPGLRAAGKVRRKEQATLLASASWRQVKGGLLLTIPLQEPALIVDAHAERAGKGRPARLVVHLARTDRRTLARLLDVPEDSLQAAPEPAEELRAAEGGRLAGLEEVKAAYRRLVEEAAAQPADIGELIEALPLEFSPKDAGAQRQQSADRKRDDAAPAPPGGGRAVIVLDPGHGGRDPGAVGARGVKEKDIVLQFARVLRDALERRGHVVVMTRTGDTFLRLRQRVQVARAHHAALFVSIHVDKFRKAGVSGLGIYTLSEEASDEDAAELARMENAADLIGAPEDELKDDEVRDILVELTQRETNANSHLLAQRLVRALRGVVRLRRNPVRSAAFRVLRAPEIPSLLVELGYITNPRDVRDMRSSAWRRKVAERMAATIDRVLKARLALR